jgi:FkbM family methyltransferase
LAKSDETEHVEHFLMTMSARSILENLLRDRARRRRLPAAFGHAPIIMSAAGGLGALVKPVEDYDPTLLRLARTLVNPGDVVWDIGANVGLFSVACAAIAAETGKVIAFEPDAVLVQLLRRTGALQTASAAPITVVPTAVARETGLRSFSIASRARASNALTGYGNSQMGGTSETQTVVTFAVDCLTQWLPIPDVMKIDVEGAETEVLLGATNLLKSKRPLIICEVSDGNAQEVSRLLHEAEYQLYDASKPIEEGASIAEASWNTVAVPAEHRARYLARS